MFKEDAFAAAAFAGYVNDVVLGNLQLYLVVQDLALALVDTYAEGFCYGESSRCHCCCGFITDVYVETLCASVKFLYDTEYSEELFFHSIVNKTDKKPVNLIG